MSANNRKTGNLLALGSAAVVAVYGTGFLRTAAAAERFAQQSNEHVLSPAEAEVIAAVANESPNGPVVPAGVPAANTPSTARSDSSTSRAPHNKTDATTAKSSASRAVVESSVAAQSPVATGAAAVTSNAPDTRSTADAKQTASTNTVAQTAATVAASVPTTVAAPPVVQPTSQTTAAPVTAASAPPANAPAPVAAPAAPAPAKTEEAAPAAPKWKDGSYTGYGTSRHGDIEVYLETDGGKISFIKISACLTQYSCSWISELPGQVIARQSPKVDAPSGATQSANAFYYAVVQALSKAK